MRKVPTLITDAICSNCCSINSFQRSTSKKLKKFETTKIYCYECMKETNHYILIDTELAYNYLKEQIELNEIQQNVLTLLNTHYEKVKVKKLKKR